jgi:uncharacterized protein involved in copper resistance
MKIPLRQQLSPTIAAARAAASPPHRHCDRHHSQLASIMGFDGDIAEGQSDQSNLN